MRLCVDVSPVLMRSAGVKNYLYYWVKALQARAGQDELRLFPFLGTLPELDHNASVLPLAATVPRLGYLFSMSRLGLPLLDAGLRGADLFHATNQVRTPPRRALLSATLHDFTCWRMPQLHTAGNREADREFADRMLRHAAGLIAVSENTRRDAIELLGLPPDRVRTIHSGVAEAFFHVPAGAAERVAASHGLRKPYLLYVGTIEPRKNVDLLLSAYRALPAGLREEFSLVIAGPEGWNARDTMARLRSGEPGVRYLGYVAEADLPALTSGALAFVYPSLYEGFGFPVAQAMAVGVPVITSNTSCLPEVAGPGALLVDPHSEAELTAALERLLLSPSLRASLGAAGRQQAEAYRWERCAYQSWVFFRELTGR